MNAGPSIADLLEQANRERAGTDARLNRRVADPLQRSGAALQTLQAGQPGGTPAPPALWGKGSFQKLTLASLRRLGREPGIKGSSKLQNAALAKVLEAHGVIPPPPLERVTTQERIALVRRLLAGPEAV